MNTIFTKAISLILIAELVVGTYPVRAMADNKDKATEVTSPEKFIAEVKKESEAIFGKHGCAKMDDNGKITYVNQTTVSGIQNDDEKSSIDCKARIENHGRQLKKVNEMLKEYKAQQKKGLKNEDCPDCGVNNATAAGNVIPEGGVCSANEKKKVESERNKNPQCSFGCELKGSVKKTLGSTIGGLFVKSDKSCNVDKGGQSYLGCLTDVIKSLFTSLGSMLKSAWEGIKAAGSWVAGLFSSNKKTEKHATDSGKMYSGMSDKEIKEAQKNPKKANEGFMAKIANGFSWIMENVVGLDAPMYSEMWKCAGCGKRISVICQMVGVLGKDIIKNAILIWVGGKAIQGAGKLLKGAFKGAKFLGKGTVNLAAKTTVGSAVISWGARNSARLSSNAVTGFERFLETKVGKASAYLANKGTKGVSYAADGLQKIDDAMMAVPKLFVRGGKQVGAGAKALMNRSKVFAATPGLADDAIEAGLKSTKDLPKNAHWEIEVPNQALTKEMEASKKLIDAKVGKNAKGFTDDIQNAAESEFKVTQSGIKVDTEAGTKYIAVKNSDDVIMVKTFNDGKRAMIVNKDGSVKLFNEGKPVGYIKASEAKKVDALVKGDPLNADDLAMKTVKENAEASGLKVVDETPNASTVGKVDKKKLSVDTGGACNTNISITAGKAL